MSCSVVPTVGKINAFPVLLGSARQAFSLAVSPVASAPGHPSTPQSVTTLTCWAFPPPPPLLQPAPVQVPLIVRLVNDPVFGVVLPMGGGEARLASIWSSEITF